MLGFGRRIHGAAPLTTAIPAALPGSAAVLRRLLAAINVWFWAAVGIPTLLAGIYCFGIASDLYVSEAKFVVRGPHQPAVKTGSIAAMLSGAGLGGFSDAAEVRDFMLSRDTVHELEQRDDLRAVLSRPEGDLLSRFPGIQFWRRDFEALFETYQRFVTVEVDEASGVVTLQVKAYRPEDAQRIAQTLLTYGERLVNEINAREREDALSTFEGAVRSAERRIAEVQDEMAAYRIRERMLDPISSAEGPLVLASTLNKELAGARTHLADLLRTAPRSPGVALLRTRIASLEKLVADQHLRMTGDSNSVATKAAEFERLEVQQKLDQKALESAFSSLEAARLEVQRKQVYLEDLVQPNLPDYPLYPKRLVSFSMVLASCFIGYAVGWLLVAGIREHAAA